MIPLSCFKAYDIRGRVPDELNEETARRIGRGYAEVVEPRGPVAVGWDIRLTSPALAQSVIRGLNESGVDTLELGLCGTETVYHAAAQPGIGGGIMVTASHNPGDYNGMKLVREDAIPLSGDSSLHDIERLAREDRPSASAQTGISRPWDITASYVNKVLSFVDRKRLKPLHLVVNAGNGAAGPTFDAIATRLPFLITRIHHETDGTFPHGIPNPLLPENRAATAAAVIEHGADMGIAWDGDFDRCFFFDEQGNFIEGYYIVGMLAKQLLKNNLGGKIIHDPRLIWNTIDLVQQTGGVPIMSKTGHAFIKERMRREDAVYGGEMSAHHYFRDFAYCDSGMIPWLLVAEYLSISGQPLSALVAERIRAYPCSGEINFRVNDAAVTIAAIETYYQTREHHAERTDGLSMDFGTWRFNLRSSNTEPLLRLNVEARDKPALVREQVRQIEALIKQSLNK